MGTVLESRLAGIEAGDIVQHARGYRGLAVVDGDSAALGGAGRLTRLDPALAPPEVHLGLLGGTGLTAWAGIVLVASARAGDTVWVSAAAGAVGSVAAQLAKARGCRVVGSAGSPDKVTYLRDVLGLDAAFDYHQGLGDQLREAAPEGIDVYFDNVGGAHLEAALDALRPFGRVALCGAISGYNGDRPQVRPTCSWPPRRTSRSAVSGPVPSPTAPTKPAQSSPDSGVTAGSGSSCRPTPGSTRHRARSSICSPAAPSASAWSSAEWTGFGD